MNLVNVSDIYVESAGGRYKVATLQEFRAFRQRICQTEGWKQKFKSETVEVYTQHSAPDGPGAGLNIVKVLARFPKVSALTMYNALHDSSFRKSWDNNMIEGYNLVQLDLRNDIGYYAAKFPFPLANRDFLNQRSWMEFTNGEYIIFNHSVPHASCPVNKDYVRGLSYTTGYYMRPQGSGCELLYMTHSDPQGSIPHMILNSATTRMVPSLMDKLDTNGQNYTEWAKGNHPASFKPSWRSEPVAWDDDKSTDFTAVVLLAKASSETSIAPSPVSNDSATGAAVTKLTEISAHIKDVRNSLALAQKKGTASVSLAALAPKNSDDAVATMAYRTVMDAACGFVDRQFQDEGALPTVEDYYKRLLATYDSLAKAALVQAASPVAPAAAAAA